MSRLWETGPRSPDDPGRYILKAVRDKIMERDSYTCQYCGREATDCDHVYPWSNGGTHHERNLVASCSSCNSIAGQRIFTEFMRKKAYILARRAELRQEKTYE